MSDRREPTISGMRVDADDPRLKARAAGAQGTSAQGAPTKRVPARPQAPARQVIVKKSPLAPIALLFAFAACAAAGYLYQQLVETQNALLQSNKRLVSVEASLKLTGSESMQSVGEINESLKTHFSEIDKLWAAYRKHKTGIEKNKKAVTSAVTASGNASKASAEFKKHIANLTAESQVVSELVDAQQGALTSIEQKAKAATNAARSASDASNVNIKKITTLEKSIKELEQDIEAINGFRRVVNQQLLELKGGAQ